MRICKIFPILLFSTTFFSVLSAQPCSIPVGNVVGGGNICVIYDNGNALVSVYGSVGGFGDGIFHNLLRNGIIVPELSYRDSPYWSDREFPGPGRYTIQAYNTFCSVMFNGYADITYNTGINQHTFYGNANTCYEGQLNSVVLTGSQVGVDYQLRLGQEEVRPLKPGTGGQLIWNDLTLEGVYTAIGVKPDGCMQPMTGSAVISHDFQIAALDVVGGGNICLINDNGSPLVSISLNGSSAFGDGIFYTLVRNGIDALPARDGAYWADRELPGPGYYTVYASNEECPYVPMRGGVTVTYGANITQFSVGGGGFCCSNPSESIQITLSDSEIGIDYQLRLGQEQIGNITQGTGAAISWSNLTHKGVYTIYGITALGCSVKMNGEAFIFEYQDVNYVKSEDVQQSGITDASVVQSLNSYQVLRKTEFYDGLGRKFQTVQDKFSPLQNDFVEVKQYNKLGLQERVYLPFSTSQSLGALKSNPVNSLGDYTHDFYSNFFDNVADGTPYSQTIFEPSPLNRVLKQGAPGEAWQPDATNSYSSTDHSVKFAYEFNQPSEVLLWSFTYPTDEYTTSATNAFGKINAGTATAPLYYAANQLYKNKTKDEQGNQVIEYVDKDGHTVLKRVQAISGNVPVNDINYASTYYVYNYKGNLVCVIPPEATARLATEFHQSGSTDVTKNDFLKRWAFRYRYDGRKRMTMKQVPGAEPVYMVYDNRDRLVLTQDGNQRLGTTKYWTFTKYDVLNRPVFTGLYTNTSTLSAIQTAVHTYYSNLTATQAWHESYIGNATGNVHGYNNYSFPQEANVANYLTVTYYDNYNFRSLWKGNYGYQNEQNTTESIRVIGQVTGTKVKVLDGYSLHWIQSVNYYDDKYRLIQQISNNYKDGIERVSNLYDFVGKVLETKRIHSEADVLWTNVVGANYVGDNLIWTSGASGWKMCASSQKELAASTDGWVEWDALDDRYKYVGFAETDNGLSTVYKYAFHQQYSDLYAVENGTLTLVGTYVIGDVLRVERTGTTITFKKNGVILRTSAIPSSSKLKICSKFFNAGTVFAGVRSSFTGSSTSITERFEYDHAGRLKNTWHQLDAQPEILLVHNEYNELGQLIDKKLHSTVADASDARQSVDYRYNIRGWLTSINNAQLANDPMTNDDATDYFGMNLAYNNTNLGLASTGLYNGNISAMSWSNNQGIGSIKQNGYAYSYDPMNRILSSTFKENTTINTTTWSTPSNNAFAENGFSYDLNGNIKSLTRNDKRSSGTMDQLTYNYGTGVAASNKLLSVTDTGDDTQGFKEIEQIGDDYTYDDNGNLLYDKNKASEELVKNGDFENGSAQWTTTESSRLQFVNGRVNITAGAAQSLISQPCPIKQGGAYIVKVDMARTSGTATIQIRIGLSATNIFTTTSFWVNGGATDDIRLEVQAGFAGYVNNISVHAATAITYNLLNLPETVNQGDYALMRYIYTATGQKLAQTVESPGYKKHTDYAGEYIYQNDTLQFINHEEGRIIPAPAEASAQAWEYQYHLKDHLGNVRTTFTTKEEIEAPAATLETTNTTAERSNFLKYDDVRKVNSLLFDHTTSGATQYAIRLAGTANETYGLARSLAVVPGDKLKAEVFAKYLDPNTSNWTTALTNLVNAIATGTASAGTVIDGGMYGTPTGTTIPFAGLLARTGDNGTGPKAYLNWLVFNKNFILIPGQSGFKRLTEVAKENGVLAPEGVLHEKIESPEITIAEPGFVYIYLSNEEPGKEVYFDDFKVTHTKSPVIQSDDYYPFGLTFNSYKRENGLANQYSYNGKEKQDELGLDWLDYGARMYMADIGRFNTADKLSETSLVSPYIYAGNDPSNSMDINGDFRITKDFREKFPKVAAFIEKNLRLLAFNTFIVNSISKNTGLDKSSIRRDFKNNKGPIIDISNNHSNWGADWHEEHAGEHFKDPEGKGNDYLAINSKSILEKLENALNANDLQSLNNYGFFAMITIIHEYIHNASGRTGYVPAGAKEVGWHWEGDAFGRTFEYPTIKMSSEYGGDPRNTVQSFLKGANLNDYMFMGMGINPPERKVDSPYHPHKFQKNY